MSVELAIGLFVVSVLLVILGMILSVGNRIGSTDKYLKSIEDIISRTGVKKKTGNTLRIPIMS